MMYAIKFSSLQIDQLAEMVELQERKKYRFYYTYGIFRGWEIEKTEKLYNYKFMERAFEYCVNEFDEI